MANFKILILFAFFFAHSGTQPSPDCTEEQYRPRYHFSSARRWLGDPNGMVYYNATYHLYFQYDLLGTGKEPKHWGHAMSTDMAFWEEVEVALYPDALGEILDGSAVVDYDNTTGFQINPDVHTIIAMFTLFLNRAYDNLYQISLAFSNDYGRTFTKYQGNPVIPDRIRDPKVIRYGTKWIVVVVDIDRNRIAFYSSDNMKAWTRTSEFSHSDDPGGQKFKPDLVKLPVHYSNGSIGEMWVLMVSAQYVADRGHGTHYFVGSFNGTHFSTTGWDSHQWVDWGQDSQAGQTFSHDPQARDIHMAWMSNILYGHSLPTETWKGQVTLPRELGLRLVTGDGSRGEHYRLTSKPVVEVQNLRDQNNCLQLDQFQDLSEDASYFLGENLFPALELEITLEMLNEPEFEICGTNQQDTVCLKFVDNSWVLDREKTSNTGFDQDFARMLTAVAPSELPFEDNMVTVRIFLDVSTIEVFIDDGLVSMTSLYFPSSPLVRFYVHNQVVAGRDTRLIVHGYFLCELYCDHDTLTN